ncbi:MAG: TetR/AcrR family transcriptional regulator [Tetrasphaera sp.]
MSVGSASTAMSKRAARGDAEGAPAAPKRSRDPERTQADLLAVATQEFARLGYFGARVDEIADKSATTKRMIYYYFRDKRGLYTAVLEQAYAGIRAAEQALHLADLPPSAAMALLIRHTFDYHAAHPELGRLVSAENALGAEALRSSTRRASVNLPIVGILDDILARGRASGEFQRRADALELHLFMSALALYPVTNVATIEATFGVDIGSAARREQSIETVTDMVLAWLRTPRSDRSTEPLVDPAQRPIEGERRS